MLVRLTVNGRFESLYYQNVPRGGTLYLFVFSSPQGSITVCLAWHYYRLFPKQFLRLTTGEGPGLCIVSSLAGKKRAQSSVHPLVTLAIYFRPPSFLKAKIQLQTYFTKDTASDFR